MIWLLTSPSVHAFKVLFIGILLEALPFILLGVLLSALLQTFVSDETIARLTPKNPVPGVLFGSLLGLFLPLCECGMIPVVRRLIRKGMPPYIGIVYIFAGPVVNPIVFSSTYAAFRGDPAMAFARTGLALAVCIPLGLLLRRFLVRNPLRSGIRELLSPAENQLRPGASGGLRFKLEATLAHASDEFIEMGKYLVAGALIAALMQTALDPGLLSPLGSTPLGSHTFMMGLAFALSLCSTTDAFVASSLSGIFPRGALLAFLVFGPMVDLKSTLMLLSAFRTKVVLAVLAFLFAAVLAGSLIAERLMLHAS